MVAYVIADLEITDPEAFAEYSRRVPDSLARHGGRYLARGGRVEHLEGEWRPRRVVAIAFDSVERARAWWTSPEYEELRRLRQRSAIVSQVVVEGL
jgi:uncharacterized protein (DUF1330 family)